MPSLSKEFQPKMGTIDKMVIKHMQITYLYEKLTT